MSASVPIKYRAFLSYSHQDRRTAEWLHRSLEGFAIDHDLAGRETPLGPVPKSLRPIFRDREDFSGGPTLTDATVAALDSSAALIVLCSPAAAASHCVNEEVRLFKQRHPDRPVIPVIADGEPPDCFPLAAGYEVDADGAVTQRPVTVLAPDLREAGDGRALGLAKVVAGLVGVGTDEIFRRAERARRVRARARNAIIAALALLAVASTARAKLANAARKSGDAATAHAEFAAARDISARLAALSQDNADWKNDLAWIDAQLAGLGK